jgi:hypothetical protein
MRTTQLDLTPEKYPECDLDELEDFLGGEPIGVGSSAVGSPPGRCDRPAGW